MPNVNFGIIQPTKQLGLQDVWKPIGAVEKLQTLKAGLTLKDMYEERSVKDEFKRNIDANKKRLAAWKVEKESLDTLVESIGGYDAMADNEGIQKEIKRVKALRPASAIKTWLDIQQSHGNVERVMSVKTELRKEADATKRFSAVLASEGRIDEARAVLNDGRDALEVIYPTVDWDLTNDEFKLFGAGMFDIIEGKEEGNNEQVMRGIKTLTATKKGQDIFGSASVVSKILGIPKKEPKRAWKVAPDPSSSTGFIYKDLESGASGGEAPKPSALVNIEMGKPASAAERTAMATGAASIDTLNNLKTLFDEAFVGPFAGRAGTAKEIFGGNPQKQSEFIAATAAFKNQIIKEITGAQMSEPEAERIMKQVPDVNNPPSVWQARWKQSIGNIKRIQKRRAEVLRQSGLKVPLPDDNIAQPQTAEDYLNSIGR